MTTSRRKAIQLGISGLLLPVLRVQDSLGAEGGAKRLIFFYTGNGTVDQVGPAEGSEYDFNIKSYFSPLDRPDIRNNGIFINRTRHCGGWGEGKDVHGNNTLVALTHSRYGKGPSIDQFIANGMGRDANMVFSLAEDTFDGPFFESAGVLKQWFVDPFVAHAKLFNGVVKSPQESMQMILDQKSILDVAYKNCKSQRNRFLGKEGKIILEQYCENIRNLEIQMQKIVSPTPKSCKENPELITRLSNNQSDVYKSTNYDLVLDAFNQLTAMAFQCESKSIVGINMGWGEFPTEADIDSAPSVEGDERGGPRHHPWTHNGDADKRQRNIKRIYNWYSKRFVAMYDTLKNTMDVTGRPIADSTIMTWVGELGGAEDSGGDIAHQSDNHSITVLGSGNGYLKTGRCLTGNNRGEAENGLYLALAHYMGVKAKSFGDGIDFEDRPINSNGPWSKLFE